MNHDQPASDAVSSATGRTKPLHRPGLAVLILVVVVAMITLAVMTIGIAGRDDLTLAVLRVESIRSLYAAESAGRVVAERVLAGDEITVGDVVSDLPHAEGVVVLEDGPEGRYHVEGRSGRAVRRLEFVLAP